MPVAVVVDEGTAGVPAFARAGDAGFFADVSKRTVAVVVVEDILAKVGHEEIVKAIVVVIADANSLAPAGMKEARFGGDIRESSIAIVFEKVIGGFLACWKTFQARAVHEENVQPTVVVVIVESDATARGFEKVFVLVLAAKNGFDVEAGVARDVEEGDAKIVWAVIRRLEQCGDGVAGSGLLRSKWDRQSEYFFEREHQSRAAERVEKFAARSSQENRYLS